MMLQYIGSVDLFVDT